MMIPAQPKLYHIVHVDRLPGIVAEGQLWCDREMLRRASPGGMEGTKIGLPPIKERRLNALRLASHPDLFVGDCVPFYFCPRSVMLYLIHRANHPGLVYRGGQEPILHLEADLRSVVDWAGIHGARWAFTLSNAGSYYFEDRCDLAQLDEIDWVAVHSREWVPHKENKQAEFLLERAFPWRLVERIGVRTSAIKERVTAELAGAGHCPAVEWRPDWYY